MDNDPVVLSHARALLASDPAGATAYVDADLRDPQKILASAAEQLDFGRPVALMLMAILQHLGEEDDPYGTVATLLGALPPGSYLALSHPAKDINAAAMAKMAESLNQMMAEKVTFRDRSAVIRFFGGLDWSSRRWCRRRNGGRTASLRQPARRPCGPAWRARADRERGWVDNGPLRRPEPAY